MIAKLSGLLDSVAQDYLILDVNGVGYKIFASPRTLSRAGANGAPLSLLIETQVREDAFNLYGFTDAAEQTWFRLLTGVQGVGAKAALAILGVCPPENLGFSIAAGDKAALTRAEGVGPKIAARIVTELKDKAGKMDLAGGMLSKTVPDSAVTASVPPNDNPDAAQDAVSALVNLGYARTDAYQAVLQAQGEANDNADVSALIRAALKVLGG